MAKMKVDNRLLSVNQFASIARTTRATLCHYDKLGLISPMSRGEDNKYRYYVGTQEVYVNLIHTFQSLGMSLGEIKDTLGKLNAETSEGFFIKQMELIDEKMEQWARAKKLLYTYKQIVLSVKNIDVDKITISQLPAEAIILGDLNDYSNGRRGYDALISFLQTMKKRYPKLDVYYPIWQQFSQASIKQGNWDLADRFYFYNPEGYDRRPAALYAIGYMKGWYGNSYDLYERMLKYVDENGYEICGDAYEEHPINEFCMSDENNYLKRVMITVRKKRSTKKAHTSM